jgi:hypothetical protein
VGNDVFVGWPAVPIEKLNKIFMVITGKLYTHQQMEWLRLQLLSSPGGTVDVD